MNTYVSLHNHSFFSLLDGLSSPEELVLRAKDLGMPAMALTDHGSISGMYRFIKACNKHGIKPICGVEKYVSLAPAYIKDSDHKMVTHMPIYAKNKNGWVKLMQLLSLANSEEYFYYRPRIHLKDVVDDTGKVRYGIQHFAESGDLIGISGHQGSYLSNVIFCNMQEDQKTINETIKNVYNDRKIRSTEYYEKFLRPNWLEECCKSALEMQDVFGKNNFYLEIQNELNHEDALALYIHPVIVKCLRAVSKETGIPCVPTGDVHYSTKEEAEDQRCLMMIQQKITEADAEEKVANNDDMIGSFLGSQEFYIHSYDEMVKKGFSKKELENTIKFADSCEAYDIASKPLLPKFAIPEYDAKKYESYLKDCTTDADKYLKFLCIEGAGKRKPWETSTHTKEEYWEQLDKELKVIEKAKLADYFLIVQDYCNAARNRPADHSFDYMANLAKGGKLDSIAVGPGRGSAAGSVISYFIGITNVDPLLYGLWFTRFYNEGRNTADHISLPDIDTDFSVTGRDWVVDYLKWKYGDRRVAHMVTFGRLMGRGALKDVFRVKGIENAFEKANEICQFVPDESQIADEINEAREDNPDYGVLQWSIDNLEDIKRYYNSNLKPLFDQALRLEGVKRTKGIHASGIVIMADDIDNHLPMVYDARSKTNIVAFEMADAEACGGVKFDLLGLASLERLSLAQKLIRENPGKIKTKSGKQFLQCDCSVDRNTFNIDNIPLDCEASWDLISSGHTKGIFQFDTKLAQGWAKGIKPNSIEYLAATSALLRPGCLESGMTASFAKIKNSGEQPEYLHPALEPILESTHGQIVYQEQTMSIVRYLAGFSETDVDTFRKGIGKKKSEIVMECIRQFEEAAIKMKEIVIGNKTFKPLTKEEAKRIGEWMAKFQRYGFNKAHAISYALLGYQTAFVKTHFPREFYCAWLTLAEEKSKPREEIAELVNDCKRLGATKILPPNLKDGNLKFKIMPDDTIRFGLSSVKNVGVTTLKNIKELDLKTMDWNKFVVNITKIRRNVAEALVMAGACDYFGFSRAWMLKVIETIYGTSNKEDFNGLTNKEFDRFVDALTVTSDIPTSLEITATEASIKSRGQIIKQIAAELRTPFLDRNYEKALHEIECLGINLSCSPADDISPLKYNTLCKDLTYKVDGENVRVGIFIDSMREGKTKKGEPFAYLNISDKTGGFSNVVAWPDTYNKYSKLLKPQSIVILSGRTGSYKGDPQLIVKKVEKVV